MLYVGEVLEGELEAATGTEETKALSTNFTGGTRSQESDIYSWFIDCCLNLIEYVVVKTINKSVFGERCF